VGGRLTAWLTSRVRARVRACGRAHPSWAREPHTGQACGVTPVTPASHQRPAHPLIRSPRRVRRLWCTPGPVSRGTSQAPRAPAGIPDWPDERDRADASRRVAAPRSPLRARRTTRPHRRSGLQAAAERLPGW